MKILTHRPTDRRPIPYNPKRRADAAGKAFYNMLMTELQKIKSVGGN